MKKTLLLAFIALLSSLVSPLAFSAEQEPAKEKQLWTCGMHPQVVLDHPGDCPICHMKLVPLKKNSDSSGAIEISPEAVQAMNLKTVKATTGPVSREVRAVGAIAFDETSLADVTTKFRGWVEKLNVDFTGREVHKGETLLEIYSPELYNAQAEYLVAKRQLAADPRLVENAKLKLKLFDFPDSLLESLEKSGVPLKAVPVLSPRDGVVVEKDVVQGQMVEPGGKLYRIADLGTVWALVQIYESDLPFVKAGQPAEVESPYLAGRRYHGAVTYVYPTVDEATRTAKARIELHNPGYFLKPGMYVNAAVKETLTKDGLLIPDSAVLRGGDSDIVFVALDGGRYEPREVKLGPLAGKDLRQIVSGLKAGESVVSSGQFLLDSEANLRAAVRRLSPPSAKGPSDAFEPEVVEAPKEIEYVCPMPEHMSVGYKEPGKCPLCGMTLVPADASQVEAAKKLDHYACPMHPEVVSGKPGKCSKCGMTLIPVYAKETKEEDAKADIVDGKIVDHYECPMKEDDYRSPKPGKCPKCGMDLAPVFKK